MYVEELMEVKRYCRIDSEGYAPPARRARHLALWQTTALVGMITRGPALLLQSLAFQQHVSESHCCQPTAYLFEARTQTDKPIPQ